MEAVQARIDDPNLKENEWVKYGLKLGVQSLLHPLEYSKVLIQVRTATKKIFVYFRESK